MLYCLNVVCSKPIESSPLGEGHKYKPVRVRIIPGNKSYYLIRNIKWYHIINRNLDRFFLNIGFLESILRSHCTDTNMAMWESYYIQFGWNFLQYDTDHMPCLFYSADVRDFQRRYRSFSKHDVFRIGVETLHGWELRFVETPWNI